MSVTLGDKTEQEQQIAQLYGQVVGLFNQLDSNNDPAKEKEWLKEITSLLKDAKGLIKEFEMEARSDGMAARELAARKKELVEDLNHFIAMKKGFSDNQKNRTALLDGAEEPAQQKATDGMTVKELMQLGRKEVAEIDQALLRAERIVENTKEIGATTAATLNDQSKQMDKIVDDLNEIEMDMKTASKVIRDIGKGLVTDKCIMFLMFLAVAALVALIILKIINPKKLAQGAQAVYNDTCNALNSTCNLTAQINSIIASLTGRKMLNHVPYADLQLVHDH